MHADLDIDLPMGSTRSTTRRQFFHISLGATAGLAAILSAGISPAIHAPLHEITLLSPTHFVPASDRKLQELVLRFTKNTGIHVTIDHIASPQLPAKLAAEVQMQSGHDIVDLRMHMPLYHEAQLVDLTDIVMPLAEKNGGMYSFCAEAALVQGRWQAMPWHHHSFPGSYNKAYFDQVDEKAPSHVGRPPPRRQEIEGKWIPHRHRDRPDLRRHLHPVGHYVVLWLQDRGGRR